MYSIDNLKDKILHGDALEVLKQIPDKMAKMYIAGKEDKIKVVLDKKQGRL